MQSLQWIVVAAIVLGAEEPPVVLKGALPNYLAGQGMERAREAALAEVKSAEFRLQQACASFYPSLKAKQAAVKRLQGEVEKAKAASKGKLKPLIPPLYANALKVDAVGELTARPRSDDGYSLMTELDEVVVVSIIDKTNLIATFDGDRAFWLEYDTTGLVERATLKATGCWHVVGKKDYAGRSMYHLKQLELDKDDRP